jgi:hypothetical protein
MYWVHGRCAHGDTAGKCGVLDIDGVKMASAYALGDVEGDDAR